jgi:hypothetical protein
MKVYGGMEVQPHAFPTMAIDINDYSVPHPGHTLGKNLW